MAASVSKSTGSGHSTAASTAQTCSEAKYELAHLKLPVDAGNKTFTNCLFPADRIAELFTKQKIDKILSCNCEECLTDRNTFEGPQQRADYVDKIAQQATSLFALLLHIGHPSLIIGFLQHSSDSALENPSIYSEEGLAATHWSGFQKEYPIKSKTVESWFHTYKHQFAVPLLDPTYQVYPDSTVLPFVNQTLVGQGTYGTVYRVEIPQHYRQRLSNIGAATAFARKELKSGSNAAFWLETENLGHIRELFDDKHVVRMIKPYRYKNVFNILFPCAEQSLDKLLRNSSSRHDRHGRLEDDPIWHQMLGISTALRNMSEGISKFKVPDGERWIGYHFDLKPANVLVFPDRTWAVSDFGQASFKQKAAASSFSSSDFTNQGGSDPYSAPEIQHPSAKAGPKYDVWSLGCILLEVTVFLLLGPRGLTGPDGLDQVRRTTPPRARGVDSRLWQHMGGDKYVVKPEVEEFMKRLITGPDLEPNSKSRQFLEAILVLVHGMLEPVPAHRKALNAVVRQLDAIINDFKPPQNAIPRPTNPLYGERQLGASFLTGKNFWHFANPEDQRDERGAVGVDLYLYEKQRGQLRITMDKPHERENFHIYRQTTCFVPIYAFDLKQHEYHSHRHFYISPLPEYEPRRLSSPANTDAESLILQNLMFSVSSDRGQVPNARLAQSAFTGQEVIASFPINTFGSEKFRSRGLAGISHPFHHVFRNGEKNTATKLLDEDKASLVQIWRECRPVWGSNGVLEKVQPRRLAIFSRTNEIHLLRFTKVCMIEHKPEIDPVTVRFVLIRSDRTPNFPMSVLTPPAIHSVRPSETPLAFAGIPLDPANLEKQENKTKSLYVTLDLTFKESEDASQFVEIYKNQKWEWSEESSEVASRAPEIP